MGPVTTEGVILVDAPNEEVLGGVDAGVTGIRYITHIKCEVEYIFADDEKKIREEYYGEDNTGNIAKATRLLVKKSKFITG